MNDREKDLWSKTFLMFLELEGYSVESARGFADDTILAFRKSVVKLSHPEPPWRTEESAHG